jgi:hypothetical protein
MKKEADRIDKMDRFECQDVGSLLTLAKTVSHEPFDSLDDRSVADEFCF